MISFRTVLRASLVFLSLTGLIFAGATKGKVGVATGADPPVPVDINADGSFSITPDGAGGGIFELINDSSNSITSFDLNLNLVLPTNEIGAGGTGTTFTPTDGGIAGLNVTVDLFTLPTLASAGTLQEAFESYLFTTINFVGETVGACGSTTFTPLNDTCLTVQYAGGATITPNTGTNSSPSAGSFFIIDLNTPPHGEPQGGTDICNLPDGCDGIPYGGLLPTANFTGAGGFLGDTVGGQSTSSTPEPAELPLLIAGGLAGTWLLRRRRSA